MYSTYDGLPGSYIESELELDKEQELVDQEFTHIINMIDFLEFLQPIWKSYRLKNQLVEIPKFQYFTTHIEVNFDTIRLDYWCNDANFAFESIQKLNPYSIIVTSGTLSPLDNFEKEIGVDFLYKY